jgi:two-component system, OmpR family, osmolarity sensor histidine kinase EnvZ
MTPLPRGVFGQLVLVIALTLTGTAALAMLLGRELVMRPAASHLLRTMDGFAEVVEELDRELPRASLLRTLRDAGLEVSETPPVQVPERGGIFVRELTDQARQLSSNRRDIQLARQNGRGGIWFKLDTAPPLWASFTQQKPREGVRWFSVLMLAGSVPLVWLAAAYFARRLVLPLRQLARAAPGIARGDPLPAVCATSSHEVSELAQSLAAASAQVRSTAEERAIMLAGISHDLRTPLTRVQYAVELLPDTDAELRAGIERDVEEIDTILTQFINYARDGRDEASEVVNLADICRNAVAAAMGEWRISAPDDAPIRGRPMALLRAVSNLLTNAVRHGAPPFSLDLQRAGEWWIVEVADQGPGLSAEDAARLRRPFARSSKHGGSGLGLAIVDRVAHQHRGDLQLIPNEQRGLRAILRLRGD